jgi:hypothetical protein
LDFLVELDHVLVPVAYLRSSVSGFQIIDGRGAGHGVERDDAQGVDVRFIDVALAHELLVAPMPTRAVIGRRTHLKHPNDG